MSIQGVGLISPVLTFENAGGVPYAGGSVAWVTVGGSVTNYQTVYTDPALSVPAQNPTVLDSFGRCTIYLGQIAYDYYLFDALGNQIYGPITVQGSQWPGQVQGIAKTSPLANTNGLANRFTTTINKASTGTHTLFAGTQFDTPTIGAGSAGLTEAATVVIAGAPSAAVTNWALDVQGGNVNVAGGLTVGGTLTGGSFSFQIINSAITIPVNTVGVAHSITETITTPATGTNALIVGTRFLPPTMSLGGAAVTELTTVYIDSPPSDAGTNFSLHVQGNSQFDSGLNIGGNLQAFGGVFEYFRGVPLGSWTDVAFSVFNYATNSGGSITPTSGPPYIYRYALMGKTMALECSAKITVNNAATTDLRFLVPSDSFLPYSGPDLQPATPCLWSAAGTAALGAAYLSNTTNFVVVQRFDGTAGAVFPTADVTVRFTIIIPIT